VFSLEWGLPVTLECLACVVEDLVDVIEAITVALDCEVGQRHLVSDGECDVEGERCEMCEKEEGQRERSVR
jgi:hypothetical protein